MNKLLQNICYYSILLLGCPFALAQSESSPAPTHSDIVYGPYERNVLDLWRAEELTPTPVLIYFHGGSFRAGDKASVRKRPIFEGCLHNGISLVSANYRFSSTAPYPAPMQDGARVLQFVRSKAQEWRLDPDRIALSGGSAGGTLALWIALRDDMADPQSLDPVDRLSTRVACLVGYAAPASFDPDYIFNHTGSRNVGGGILQLLGASAASALQQNHFRQLLREAAPINHVSADDPPLWLNYKGRLKDIPFAPSAPQKVWIHHVALGEPLRKEYERLGLVCHLYDQEKHPDMGSEIRFLIRHLRPVLSR